MSDHFDPYYEWLGIPPKNQPPNHYRLLAVDLFEPNAAVIDRAADRAMSQLRTFQSGPHGSLSQKLLNEVSNARVCLLDPQQRSVYDAELRARLEPEAGLPVAGSTPQVAVPLNLLPTATRVFPSQTQKRVERGGRRRSVQAKRVGLGAAAVVLGLVALGALWVAINANNVPVRKKELANASPAGKADRPSENSPESTTPAPKQPWPAVERKPVPVPDQPALKLALSKTMIRPVSQPPSQAVPEKMEPAGAQSELPAAATSPISGVPQSSPEESKSFTNSIGLKFVRIPAGEFTMGSPDDEPARRADEGPEHRVRITRPFFLGATEVTVGQFRLFVEQTRKTTWKAPFPQGDDHPAVNVSWFWATEFCEWLSQKEQKKYRLPTEAEWEYACRADSRGKNFLVPGESLSEHAWYNHNSNRETQPVGAKTANPWGLFDMYGNVWEWVADRFDPDYYQNSPVDDPTGPEEGSQRIARGASWWNGPADCRSAIRSLHDPRAIAADWGFRVACESR